MIALSKDEEAQYMRSPITGQWYLVTEWEDVGGKPGKHIAKEKEPVDESEVPDEILESFSSTPGDRGE